MSKMIRIKRGTDAARSNHLLALGELLWTTDTNVLWIGDGITLGGIKVTASSEVDFIRNSERAVANGVATLNENGKIPDDQLPPLSLTETFVVNSELEMVNLDAQMGDVAIRTDIDKTYIKGSGTTGTSSDWIELLTADGVSSVNGQTGNVILELNDLDNVDDSVPSDGFLLQFDTGLGKWTVVSPDNIGRTEFVALDDTPADYTNSDGYLLQVDETNNQVIFTDVIDGGTYQGTTSAINRTTTVSASRRVATPRPVRRPRPR